jgi:hypothetical protein
MKHYVTGDFQQRTPVHLTDVQYALALDAVVKACSDVLLINGPNVLLARRKVEPQPGWWFIGGRMRPGETPQEAAARHVSHDLGLTIEASEFNFLSVASYVWARRKQQPQENGTADVALIFYAEISDGDAKKLLFRNTEEYECFEWRTLYDALCDSSLHAALHDSLESLVKTKLQ